MQEDDPYRVVDLKALRCFWAVGKHGSMTAAGIELGISEPAVSKRVKSLESYFATKLYESRGGRIRLTQPGQRVLDMAVGLFDRMEEFERGLEGQEAAGAVTVSAQDPVQLYLLPPVVGRFTRDYPRVRLRLVSRPASQIVELVRRNEVDLGVVPRRPLPDGLVFRPWRTFSAYLLTPLSHPVTRRGKLPAVEDLLNYANVMRYPLIVPEAEEGAPHRVGEALNRLRLPFNVAFEVGTLETVKRYVALGMGLGVVSGICLNTEDRGHMRALEIPDRFGGETTYGVVMRGDKYMTAALGALLSLMDASAA